LDLFRKKSIEELIRVSKRGRVLSKDLTAWDLTLLGIGAVIGTGIFVLTGTGAVTAGPGLVLSFVIAGVAAALSALSYSEFASMVPVSGSVYTYTYATLGEFIAWLVGWNLILEYLLVTSTVSVGWSGYFQSLLKGVTGLELPAALTAAPGGEGTLFNLPAFLVVILITFLLARGITESKRVNNIMVVIKTLVIILFIVVGINYVRPENWHPFFPFGTTGVFNAGALVFFAFVGFDAVAAAAEETKNPGRDLPRGIIYSLGICTLLYVIVSAVMTGIVPYAKFEGVDHPVSLALSYAGLDWMAGIVNLGAILGMTTVMLVMLYGQTRIFFSMSRDGLLPEFLSSVHPRFQTPFGATWFLGIIAALIGGLLPLERLAELVNIGTLTAFTFVSVGVLVLRKTEPELKRPFKVPFTPWIPLLAILMNLFLMSRLDTITWTAFLIWVIIGVLIYFTFSRRHSNLNQEH